MWYLDRFSLTPFDDRYLRLPYEWMEFTYLKFMETVDPEQARDWYLRKKAKMKEDEEYEKELKRHLPVGMLADEKQREEVLEAFRIAK